MGDNKINYGKVLEKTLLNIKTANKKPRLLLQCCCAPCSSYVLEYLTEYFDITAYYYNPNISPISEYDIRSNELQKLIDCMPHINKIDMVVEEYNNDDFENAISGLEKEKEGGKRCFKCYELRLKKSAEYAKQNGYDYFCTTLSISPLKNATKLNEIGKKISEETGIDYLFSDFKKNEGYKRSIELSKQYSLYRQNYCGCKYSKSE